MYSTSVFYYVQRNIVVLLSGYSPRRYMPVYAKPLTLHKGVDNQIQFQFLNQEQKPVDITGKSITCRILNYTGNDATTGKPSFNFPYRYTGNPTSSVPLTDSFQRSFGLGSRWQAQLGVRYIFN